MNKQLLAAVLMIVGTSIGAGILALPIATTQVGVINSSLLLVLVWFAMTMAAFFLLEVNLYLPANSNLISMAKATLGPVGELCAWLVYLLLLYSLLCAYIAAGSDFVSGMLHFSGMTLPSWVGVLLFAGIFGFIVYKGVAVIGAINSGLMVAKLSILFLLIALIFPHTQPDKLLQGHLYHGASAMAVITTSFGYAIIVPTLRVYLHSDARVLRRALLWGAMIPLLCYVAWIAAVLGSLPHTGVSGLMRMQSSAQPTTDLMEAVEHLLQSAWMGNVSKVFIVISIATSFLGVAISMVDFLADGLRIPKQGLGHVAIMMLTLGPPVLIVVMQPGLFIKSLQYAGILVALLLMLLPALMAWRARTVLPVSSDSLLQRRGLIGSVVFFSLAALVVDICAQLGA